MDAGELRSVLDARRYCVLATATPAGHPVARPVAFSVLGASFWRATVAGSRLRNLESTPWGSIVIADGEGDDHRAVAADGPAVIVPQPPEQLLAVGEGRHGSRATWAHAWVGITPARLISYTAKHRAS